VRKGKTPAGPAIAADDDLASAASSVRDGACDAEAAWNACGGRCLNHTKPGDTSTIRSSVRDDAPCAHASRNGEIAFRPLDAAEGLQAEVRSILHAAAVGDGDAQMTLVGLINFSAALMKLRFRTVTLDGHVCCTSTARAIERRLMSACETAYGT